MRESGVLASSGRWEAGGGGGNGLSATLRQLRDCRHSVPYSNIRKDTRRSSKCLSFDCRQTKVCITCRLATRVMKDVKKEKQAEEDRRTQERDQRELAWARDRRNVILMRHPTNWTTPLLQGPLPNVFLSGSKVAKEPVSTSLPRASEQAVKRNRNSQKERQLDFIVEEAEDLGLGDARHVNGRRVDSRPVLIPGTMLTLSSDCAQSLMFFAEEVQRQHSKNDTLRECTALDVVSEAIAEVAFINRKDGPRTDVLVRKLQAIARGWLARRLARRLLLQGGCRRELDEASGAWQYVWPYRGSPSTTAESSGKRTRQGRGQRRGSASQAGDVFRSWYPPAMLKNETLPSPRAAARRVTTERRKRDARLSLAESFREEQSERLRKKESRSAMLLSLGEVIRLVERAVNLVKGALLDPTGSTSEPLRFSVRVLHPRGGEPTDAGRAAALADTIATWHRIEHQVRQEAAGKRTGNGGGGQPLRSPSPAGGRSSRRQKGERSPQAERARKGGGDKAVALPSTNDNFIHFEEQLLDRAGYETTTSAVASLLQRRRVVIAISEGSRLGRNKEAWAASGTSPVGLGVQILPRWLHASHKFVALAHRGRLTAVSQAAPHVFWERLVTKDKEVALEGILGPFLQNGDLLAAMFVEKKTLELQNNSNVIADEGNAAAVDFDCVDDSEGAIQAAVSANTTSVDGACAEDQNLLSTKCRDLAKPAGSIDGVSSGGNNDANGESQPVEEGERNSLTAAKDPRDAFRARDTGREQEMGPWGYRSNLASLGCWKLDAKAVARKEGTVDLAYDSAAFEVVIDLASHRLKRLSGGSMEKASAAESRLGDQLASRTIVANVIPFNMRDGLPAEIAPLLFDSISDISILTGGEIQSPADESAARDTDESEKPTKIKMHRKVTPKHTHNHQEHDGSWTRISESHGNGKVLNYVYRKEEQNYVHFRIRGESLGPDELARAQLPADVSALFVGPNAGEKTDGA